MIASPEVVSMKATLFQSTGNVSLASHPPAAGAIGPDCTYSERDVALALQRMQGRLKGHDVCALAAEQATAAKWGPRAKGRGTGAGFSVVLLHQPGLLWNFMWEVPSIRYNLHFEHLKGCL